MIYPSPEEWAQWSIQEDLQKFLTLLWVELFGESTLDTWQVRTSNVRTLLQELIEAVTVAEQHPPQCWKHRSAHRRDRLRSDA